MKTDSSLQVLVKETHFNLARKTELLERLGWVIDRDKSCLIPDQEIQFLRAILDFRTSWVRTTNIVHQWWWLTKENWVHGHLIRNRNPWSLSHRTLPCWVGERGLTRAG